MNTSSPSSVAEAIPVEAVTMGTDWDAMLSPLSEGRDSVKTVTDRERVKERDEVFTLTTDTYTDQPQH